MQLLTGTYILQGNRAAFNQYQVNPTCRLCSVAPENMQHCISECLFLNPERSGYIEKLHDPEFLTQLTLDASAVLVKEQFDIDTWSCFNFRQENTFIKLNYGQLGPKTTRTRQLGPIKSRTKTTRPLSLRTSRPKLGNLGPVISRRLPRVPTNGKETVNK